MTPLQLALSLGVDVLERPSETLPDGTVVLGHYKPGTNLIVTNGDPYNTLHELSHLVHHKLHPHDFEFSNLLFLDLLADTVAVHLSILLGITPDFTRLSFQYADNINLRAYELTMKSRSVIDYVLGYGGHDNQVTNDTLTT